MLATTEAITDEYVAERIAYLRGGQPEFQQDRWRIRSIMNGGPDGLRAVMAWDVGKGAMLPDLDLGTDFPTVNLLHSGMERLAQQVGRIPTLKMPLGAKDSAQARAAAEKRERIVEGWDHMSRMKMHYPQIGRWLPGYGFHVWTISEKYDPLAKASYPIAQLRDPYDCYPGWFGPEQQPNEMAIVRRVPLVALERAYPDFNWTQIKMKLQENHRNEAKAGRRRMAAWEGDQTGIEIAEYWCEFGTFLSIPEIQLTLDYAPNPLDTGPAYVVGKRFSFDKMVSQWHHVIGLMAMMAKLNILGLIAAEDEVFAPTVITGELRGSEWEVGRNAFNELEPGSSATRLSGGTSNLQVLFQQIDRIERHLRVGSQYDVGQDAEVRRQGFITGAGQRELQGAMNANVGEYQAVIAAATELMDSKRMEWDERMHTSKQKKVYVMSGGSEVAETYVPSRDIKGNYRSRRIYGMMASWDENTKIVSGLQLIQGEILSPLDVQENLDGLDDVAKVNERIARPRADTDMYEALRTMASNQDPKALAALVEISENPSDKAEILRKYFTPQEPQMSPEEQQMMTMQGMGGEGVLPETPPDVSTVLSQLAPQGVKSGVQTVGRM